MLTGGTKGASQWNLCITASGPGAQMPNNSTTIPRNLTDVISMPPNSKWQQAARPGHAGWGAGPLAHSKAVESSSGSAVMHARLLLETLPGVFRSVVLELYSDLVLLHTLILVTSAMWSSYAQYLHFLKCLSPVPAPRYTRLLLLLSPPRAGETGILEELGDSQGPGSQSSLGELGTLGNPGNLKEPGTFGGLAALGGLRTQEGAVYTERFDGTREAACIEEPRRL